MKLYRKKLLTMKFTGKRYLQRSLNIYAPKIWKVWTETLTAARKTAVTPVTRLFGTKIFTLSIFQMESIYDSSHTNNSSVEWICECVWNDWKVSLSQSTHSPLLMWIKSSRPLTILRYCCSKRIYTVLNIHNSSQLFEHTLEL